jgi:DNA recombination protein RmuC
MNDTLLYLLLLISAAVLTLQLVQAMRARREASSDYLDARFRALDTSLERLERELRGEFRGELARSRAESTEAARSDRAEQSQSLERLGQTLAGQVGQLGSLQAQQFEGFGQNLSRLTQSFDARVEQLRLTVETRLTAIQADNSAKLEEMRKTVDEKLHATLEQRLGESFKLVSDRLEQVHRGLGEMQTLAAGVGDLKKVLTNVKTRGTWGEVQLAALLDQVLTAEQYAANVATRPGSNDRVEFAIRLPGREAGEPVWLPIDAKFPSEDYQRLVDAQERADVLGVEVAGKALETRLKDEAKTIREKYIQPPHTTDFAILYLPTEGLYAEALRRPGLAEALQRDQRVSLAGPTTLAAMLNSLQMGFRTLAIEQRSSEVWAVLGAVKTEFGKFGEALAHTRKKLQEASNTIDKAEVRTRVVTRKLTEVEAMPAVAATALLGDPADYADTDEDE